MDYKGFRIEPIRVAQCDWDETGDSYEVVGHQLVYQIRNGNSTLIYGVQSSLAGAQLYIDEHHNHWLSPERLLN